MDHAKKNIATKELIKQCIYGLLKRKTTIDKFALIVGINRERLRLQLWDHYPYIMKNISNPRIKKILLTTNETGFVKVERKNKSYRIDKKFYHLFFSLSLADNGNGYLTYGYMGKRYYYHRLIMGAKKGQEVDHVNRFKSDNRLCNLRICNRSENASNKTASGVCDTGRRLKKRYLVTINGQNVAYFEYRQEAENCYKNVHKIINGKFSPYGHNEK
jgi:hypothetical protein